MKWWGRHLLAVSACLLPAAAWAAAYQASPVRLTLTPAAPTGVITVHNDGAEKLPLQAQIFRWSQTPDGQDVFTSTDAMLVTPPIFEIAPGGVQILRVGLRAPAAPGAEQSYRLFLKELPPTPQPGFMGLQVLLDMSLPVFVQSQRGLAPVLHWRLQKAKTGEIGVQLENSGTAHAQIISFTLTAGSETAPVASMTINTYVLPGMTRHWQLKLVGSLKAGVPITLIAETNHGRITAHLTGR